MFLDMAEVVLPIEKISEKDLKYNLMCNTCNYRPRSRGDHTFGSVHGVHPSVCLWAL